jgi:hypothetical protein
MPRSMVAWIVLLSAFLIVSTCFALRERAQSRKYRYLKVTSRNHRHSMIDKSIAASGTYQDASDYALPPKQKVVTYCVIDGRLVDR